MFNLNVLRTYAQNDPASFPNSVLFGHSATTLTIYDAYPKSIFHFLILPRLLPPYKASELANLKALLKNDKARAKEVIISLRDQAHNLRKEIENEMVKRYGFKWAIWTGFHAVPSMEHLHLHVLSADLLSEKMKNKKHYNSFHPKLGFFLDIDDVLSWFDAEPSYYMTMAKLELKPYEQLLKGDLSCWSCGSKMKNIPELKAHLQKEWDDIAALEKAKVEKEEKI